MKVMSHPAIGGFLSHCGWNSVLESIWCRVPLICFPLFTDQFTNRKLVVNDWKIGINLRDGPSITREEVKEKIQYLISGQTSEELRNTIKKVSSTMKNALTSSGSSEENFNLVIENIKAQMEIKDGLAFEVRGQPLNHVWAPPAVNLCEQTT
ncbi:UNVERIFIED_CONTAM: UDP-glycosyltransferase 86A1 [Sesamum angustifolium]|uniref:UDP-glycosyltransferase 86A1 n=1 Tax=Sesamum angustifolium TaxID=2727405 RepID=A0AAW2N6A2_9LAMI